MKSGLKWVFAFVAVMAATAAAFSFYANFLLDYSLENLELALTATHQAPEQVTPLSQKVYRAVAQDLALEEASNSDVDFKNVILLEQASNSFGQTIERGGQQRAHFYLNEVARVKSTNRNTLLRAGDTLYRQWNRLSAFFVSIMNYIQRKFSKPVPKYKSQLQYSGLLLLNQAEEKEKSNSPEEAIEIYHKYLALYPQSPERGWASIALAHILVRMKEFTAAEKVLHDMGLSFSGKPEWSLANALLKKISLMKEREKSIGELLKKVALTKRTPEGEIYQLQLALVYLSSYQFVPALELFKTLENSEDLQVHQKAKFYSGWIYKMDSHYEESEKAFADLLKDSTVKQDLELALQAQLANVYFLKNDRQKSATYYQALAEKAAKDDTVSSEVKQSWTALADLEQAHIYYFDLNKPEEAKTHMQELGESLSGDVVVSEIQQVMEKSSQNSIRDRAFLELQNGRTAMAIELFKQNLLNDSHDAWSLGGLATIYALLNDMEQAKEYADKAYETTADEYTSAMRGYVYGLMGKENEAVALYQEASGINPNYIPAQFNLSYMYLNVGKYREAVVLLSDLERKLENTKNFMLAKVLNNIGYAYWGLGNKGKAAQKFRQALLINPQFDVAKKNLSLLTSNENLQAIDAS